MSPRQMADWAHEMYMAGAMNWQEYLTAVPSELHPDYDSKVLWAPTGQLWTPDQERSLECVLPVRVTQILAKQAERKITLVNLMAWSSRTI